MVALAFQNFTKAKFNHIPSRGRPRHHAALGKHVDSIIVSARRGSAGAGGPASHPGVFGPDRLDKFPKVPTAKEQGMNFAMTMWRA